MEKKWIVYLNGRQQIVAGDCDGHLNLGVAHEDGTPVHPVDLDWGIPNEWGDRFTTERIEEDYRKTLNPEL